MENNRDALELIHAVGKKRTPGLAGCVFWVGLWQSFQFQEQFLCQGRSDFRFFQIDHDAVVRPGLFHQFLTGKSALFQGFQMAVLRL